MVVVTGHKYYRQAVLIPQSDILHRMYAQTASMMAPNLTKSQQDIIDNMIHSKSTNTEIAEAAGCTTRSVRVIRSKIHYLGIPRAPRNSPYAERSL